MTFICRHANTIVTKSESMETVQIPSPTPWPMSRFGDGFRGMRGNCSMNGTAPGFNFPSNGFRVGGSDMNQGPVLLGVGSALLFMFILLLVARLWSRLHLVYWIKIDDWIVLAATVSYARHSSLYPWLTRARRSWLSSNTYS